MIFKHPEFLILFILLAIIFYFLRQIKVLHTIGFPKAAWIQTLTSKKAKRLLTFHRWLEFIIFILIIMALAQPQWIQSKKYKTKKGIDIVTILDTSGSMNAEDFKPKNRMTVAKETLVKFINKRENDRIGLVIFGTDALTKAPLTFDHNIIKNRINQTTVGNAGDGTAIGLAIATGVNRLEKSTSLSKIIILITDGVNNAGQIDPISAAKFAKSKNIKIYTIGIGDQKGAPIPIYHPTYGKRYARYPNGQLVLTEFDEATLKSIANISDGAYFNARNAEELSETYKSIDQLEKTVINTSKNNITYDLFPYFIAITFIFFLIKEALSLTTLLGVKT
ncbi:MAG: VWA domain-containing protein [Candidatus Margulisiibacteriota bacterium]